MSVSPTLKDVDGFHSLRPHSSTWEIPPQQQNQAKKQFHAKNINDKIVSKIHEPFQLRLLVEIDLRMALRIKWKGPFKAYFYPAVCFFFPFDSSGRHRHENEYQSLETYSNWISMDVLIDWLAISSLTGSGKCAWINFSAEKLCRKCEKFSYFHLTNIKKFNLKFHGKMRADNGDKNSPLCRSRLRRKLEFL